MKRSYVLGLPVDIVDPAETVRRIDEFVSQRTPRFLSFINPEIILQCRKHEELRAAIQCADLVAPDGIGVLMALRLRGFNLRERVTGTQMMYELAELSARKGHSLFFLGAAPGVAEQAVEKLKEMFPRVNIAGVRHGYFDNDDEIIAMIKKRRPDILVVCLGMVKQELWIRKHFKDLSVPVSFGNGGALDFVAGEVKRAPEWMQRKGLEWLFRLGQDFTLRRLSRQLKLFNFVFLVLHERFFKKRVLKTEAHPPVRSGKKP